MSTILLCTLWRKLYLPWRSNNELNIKELIEIIQFPVELEIWLVVILSVYHLLQWVLLRNQENNV